MKKIKLSGRAAFLAFSFFMGVWVGLSIWTERSLEFWLTLMRGETVDVPFWIAALLTLILNGFIIAINLVAELLRLVV